MDLSGITLAPNRLDSCMHSRAPGFRRGVLEFVTGGAFSSPGGLGSALIAACSFLGSNN